MTVQRTAKNWSMMSNARQYSKHQNKLNNIVTLLNHQLQILLRTFERQGDLFRECSAVKLSVVIGIDKNGLQGSSKVFLAEVLTLTNERTQRHCYLHLDTGEVLNNDTRVKDNKNDYPTIAISGLQSVVTGKNCDDVTDTETANRLQS